MTISPSTLFGVNDMTKIEAENLFEENQSLAYSVLWKNFPTFGQDEDVKQEAFLGLWRACLTYNPSKTVFSTYAYHCIINQVRYYFRRQQNQLETVSLAAPVPNAPDVTLEDLLEDPIAQPSDDYIHLMNFIKALPERHQALLRYRALGYTLEETSQKLGISRGYCFKLLTKIHEDYMKGASEDEQQEFPVEG